MATSNPACFDRRRETFSHKPDLHTCTAEIPRRCDAGPGIAAPILPKDYARSPVVTLGVPTGGKMRRLIAVAGLVGSFVLVGFTGWGDASTGGAHAASTAPLVILKAKD